MPKIDISWVGFVGRKMKTLVLCVDRDDDIGVKAGIKGPLIGRDENLAAAMKLGLVDPEDSDVNGMLGAVSLYDERVRLGEDAEVATITGDVRVGPISDRALVEQLDRVLEEVKADRTFLVSDGAEDEFIMPMIASRVRVDHVRRVFVQQSPALESTYYAFVKAMRNPKFRRRVFFPIGLSLVLFTAMYLLNPVLAPAIVVLAIGLYFLVLSLPFKSVREAIERAGAYYEGLRARLAARDVSVVFNLVALILATLGVSFGIDAARQVANLTQSVVVFLATALWWLLLGVLTFEIGKVATAYFQRGRAPRHALIVASSLMAVGFLLIAFVQVLQLIVGTNSEATLPLVYAMVGLAVFIVAVAGVSYRSREEQPTEDSWRR